MRFQKNAFGKTNFEFHAKVQNCQFGTFEPLHEIKKIICQKYYFEALLNCQ